MDVVLNKLREKNPDKSILELTDEQFATYGTVLPHVKTPEMKRFIYENTPFPADNTCSPELTALDEAIQITQYVYGETACQIGYFSDHPNKLNALEYHKCSELLVEFEPCLLIVGHIWDIHDDKLRSDDLKIFYVPADTCVELYATTLHFAPCEATTKGVRQVVCQTATTNTPLHHPELHSEVGESKYLYQRNKWVIAHPEAVDMLPGVFVGIEGDNITIRPVEE